MFPLRAATLPLFPDPALLWSQLLFPQRIPLPDSALLHETKNIAPVEVPKLSTIGHEQPPRPIALNFVPEGLYILAIKVREIFRYIYR